MSDVLLDQVDRFFDLAKKHLKRSLLSIEADALVPDRLENLHYLGYAINAWALKQANLAIRKKDIDLEGLRALFYLGFYYSFRSVFAAQDAYSSRFAKIVISTLEYLYSVCRNSKKLTCQATLKKEENND